MLSLTCFVDFSFVVWLGGTLRRDATQVCCAEDPVSSGSGEGWGCSWLHLRGGDGGTPGVSCGIPRGRELLAREVCEAPSTRVEREV